MSKRYPLIREGEGWCEITNPDPSEEYEAYRVECVDPGCPFAWPEATHSHIELSVS